MNKIIKKLGEGKTGSVYLVNVNNKKYALKKFNTKTPNIEIYNWINTLEINKQKFFIKMISKYNNELLLQLKKYQFKKNTLTDLNHKYSMLIQLFYSIYLLNSSGFIHTDIKFKNIMYDIIPDNFILINIDNTNYKINSFNKQFSLIDYDNFANKKNKMFKYLIDINYDVLTTIDKILINNINDNTELLKKIINYKINNPKKFNDIKEILGKKSHIYKKLLNTLFDNINYIIENINEKNEDIYYYIDLIRDISHYILDYLKVDYYIPLEDIIYCKGYTTKEIILYFIKKLNKQVF